MQTLITKEETTLLSLLAAAGFTRTKIKRLLAHGAITADGTALKRADQALAPGLLLRIRSAREMVEERRVSPLPIVYEDEAIVVINKPAGLLSVSTAKEKHRTAFCQLNNFITQRAEASVARIFVVHRLDRGTSGLMVFAKSEEVKRKLQEQWQWTLKRYIALVEGVPAEKNGEIISHLKEYKDLRVHSVRGEGEGKPSITEYEVLRSSEDYALLTVTITTGRKNQIRVHLADLGHPVAGDKKYGAAGDPIGRLALHAEILAFAHPLSGKTCEFKVPVPGNFFYPISGKTGLSDGPASSTKKKPKGTTMAKSQDSKKETKKSPVKSTKEKKEAKRVKKEDKRRG